MYGDYNFYKTAYGGIILSSPDFLRCAQKAASYIRLCIFGREVPEGCLYDVRMCECELAEVFAKGEMSRGLSSESTDGESKVFSAPSRLESEKRSIVARRLAMTGLLYAGEGQ